MTTPDDESYRKLAFTVHQPESHVFDFSLQASRNGRVVLLSDPWADGGHDQQVAYQIIIGADDNTLCQIWDRQTSMIVSSGMWRGRERDRESERERDRERERGTGSVTERE